MSIEKVLHEIGAAADKLLHDAATDLEKGAGLFLHDIKSLIAKVASDPAVHNALRIGGTALVETAIGAAEGRGPAAGLEAIENGFVPLLQSVGMPAEKAAGTLVKAWALDKFETATAATPEHPNG